jgi:hypothetical protein
MDLSLFLKLEPTITNGMSEFQMKHFVINDQITPYRQVRQALIEAKGRLENITMIGYDIDELRIKLEKATNDEESFGTVDNYGRRLAAVAKLRHEFEISRKQAMLTQIQREAQFFLDVIAKIAEENGGAEQLVANMNDPKFQAREESQFWTRKLARSIFSDLVNFGAVSKGVIEAIENLPIEQRQEILNEASTREVTHQKEIRLIRQQALALKDN